MKRLVFGAVLVGVIFGSESVSAAPSPADKELAKKLYIEGAAAMESGAYARACPQFEAALRLDPEHIRTAMTLGTCEQNWGKLARALTRFEYARSLAVKQNAADKLVEIDRMMASLRPNIPQLRINVPEAMAATSGLLVTRNGAPVPANEFGRLVPVDPGAYEITASAPNMTTSTQKLKLEVGQAMEVTLGVAIAATVVKNELMPQSSAFGICGNWARWGGAHCRIHFGDFGDYEKCGE
jgi:tetratricopeptide (TPR) repeat protein